MARLALDAARSLDGVVDSTSGRGRWVTPDRNGVVPGAIAVVRADGRFDVELHLVADLVPLHPLGERIRDRVERDARVAGVADLIGPVHVAFEDVDEAPAHARAEGGS
ncbi:MAG: hypothetical protein ACR2IN_05615 [Thermoleophilaceae bacterium]|nr:hypothetical protein [Thermoleophilaceae bacterium]